MPIPGNVISEAVLRYGRDVTAISSLPRALPISAAETLSKPMRFEPK